MKLYRSKQGMILGVCQGLADWTGSPAKYIRIAAVAAAFFFPWWTAAAYLVAAVLLPAKRSGNDEVRGTKENFEDLKYDAMEFARREYSEFKQAFGRSDSNRKTSEPDDKNEEKESNPGKA